MKYISTRGISPSQNFEQVLLTGLAPDGGLYVPEVLPTFSAEEIGSWRELSYPDLALKIIAPFIDGEIPEADLREIVESSYANFNHPDVAPLTQLGENEWVLELFHGPTLAFKDFALQVLGRLLDYVLVKKDQAVVILGATSGDTGSAALEGCRHSHTGYDACLGGRANGSRTYRPEASGCCRGRGAAHAANRRNATGLCHR